MAIAAPEMLLLHFISIFISELNIYLDPETERYDPARTFLKKDVQNILYRVGFDEKRVADKTNMTYDTVMLEVRVVKSA